MSLAGCLWDPDFFDDYREAGPDTAVEALDAANDDAVSTLDAGRADVAASNGLAPSCVHGECGVVAIEGAGVEVLDIAAGPAGEAWMLVAGGPATVISGRGEQPLTAAPSHLLHVAAGGFSVDFVAPLPFRGVEVIDVGNALYLSGRDTQAGDFLGTPLAHAGRSIVARVVQRRPQWWISWSSREPPRLGAEGPTGVMVAGSPGNADLFLGDAETPFHSGVDPAVPKWFIARLEGTGALGWLQSAGDANTEITGVDVGPSGQGVVTGLAGTVTTLLGEAVGPGRFLTQANAQGGGIWSQTWPDDVRVFDVSVDSGGQTTIAGSLDAVPDALPLGDVGPFVAHARPNGMFDWAVGLGSTGTLDATASRTGDPILALGTSGGGVLDFAERSLPAGGLFVSHVNSVGRALWLQRLHPAEATRDGSRHAADGGIFSFVSAAVDGPFTWNGATVGTDDAPLVVLVRFPK